MEQQPTQVAIIGAMEEEIRALLPYLNNFQQYTHLHTAYYRGQIHHKDVVVFQSGLGKVNSALTTAYIIEHFAPQYIINIGSAGGLNEKLNIGDVVISSQVAYHDVDATLLQCAPGQLPGFPAAFNADPHLISLAQQAIQATTHLQAIQGKIGSGDTFVCKPAHIEYIKTHFPDIIAVDMEAAAIAHTCYLYKTPFVVIRAVSDLVGNPNNHIDFFTFLKQASLNSAKTVEHMLCSI